MKSVAYTEGAILSPIKKKLELEIGRKMSTVHGRQEADHISTIIEWVLNLCPSQQGLAIAAEQREAIRKQEHCEAFCSRGVPSIVPKAHRAVSSTAGIKHSPLPRAMFCFDFPWGSPELDTILAALATAFERATAEKIRCQEEVNRTNKAIELANRLVKGLSTYIAGGPILVDNVEEMIGAGFDPVLCMCCDPESEIPNGDGKARTKKFRFSCFQSREYLLYQNINQPTSELLPNLLEVIWKSPTSISHEDVHNRLTPARCQAPSALVKFDRKSALASGFANSANPDYEGYHKNMDEMLPPQSSVCYGLHPNVEIAFVIITADNVLHMLLELQFKYSRTGEGTSQAVEDKPQLKEDPCVHSEPLMNSMAILASCVHN
ncbi:hypothetical protein Q9233_008677 [Columba guinea]|nr:hypothetical protein Q9233_008677 [Columba guinea]